MGKTAFCIVAKAGVGLLTGEPGVFYGVYRGRKPPGVLKIILNPRRGRPEFQSNRLSEAEDWIKRLHDAEEQAASFNGTRR